MAISAKKISLFLLTGLFFIPFVTHAELLRNLKVGMTGNDVRELQVFLNSDRDTAVSSFGAGSPGMETAYFGKATERAVMRFQEKYSVDILIPVGLTRGSGYVGPLTRNKINGLLFTKAPQNPTSVPAVPPFQAPTQNQGGTLPTEDIPYDFEAFLAHVRSVGKAQGLSEEKLKEIETLVSKEAKKQEYGKGFVAEVQKNGIKIAPPPSSVSLISNLKLSAFFVTIADVLFPKKVSALSGSPFGGMLIFPFFCTCSGNWLLTITPLPPTYVVLLTYYMGTQAYMGFNIPFGLYMVGEYTPGAGQCLIYVAVGCATIPAQGQIGPTTGSSI